MRLLNFAVAVAALALGSCSGESSRVASRGQAHAAAPASDGKSAQATHSETGLAAFYSRRFEGKQTAAGDTFRNNELVAAHPSLPMGTVVRVTELESNRSVEVEVNDRGPSAQNRREGVIIDLSQAAAQKLGMTKKDGRVKVRLEVVKMGQDPHKPLPDVTGKQAGKK